MMKCFDKCPHPHFCWPLIPRLPHFLFASSTGHNPHPSIPKFHESGQHLSPVLTSFVLLLISSPLHPRRRDEICAAHEHVGDGGGMEGRQIHQQKFDSIVIDEDPRNGGIKRSREEQEGVRRAFGGDRLRRDEWSEGAVSSLLDAYEAKWVLRNRTKLKGQDWEEVARLVSSRAAGTRSPKTMTQCKNKIESMKKRYRSESASPDASSWPLFPRLHDLLLRCRSSDPLPEAPPQPPPPPPPPSEPLMLLDDHAPSPARPSQPLMLLDDHAPPPPPPLTHHLDARNREDSPKINGVVAVPQENGLEERICNERSSNIALETDSSTPTCSDDKEKPTPLPPPATTAGRKRRKRKRQRRDEERDDDWELADSVRWLAEVLMRMEQARIETMRELEKIRAEAEAKKGEMDLRRTEIIAKTQLEIARLLVGKSEDDHVDPSLKIGRN